MKPASVVTPLELPVDAPLVVDLDGTLVHTDTLWEGVLARLRGQDRGLGLLGALLSLRRGRAAFKARLADMATPDVSTLPINRELVDWLRGQRAAGRTLVLATASDRRVAQAVARRLGLFDEVLASDGRRNLKGPEKAAALIERFGAGGFDYVGDARADLPVWRAARQAVVVGGSTLADAAGRVAKVARTFTPPSRGAALVRALRPHQWVKNLLLLLPLIAAHQLGDSTALLAAALAFAAFSLTASAVYVLNDLLDLLADRAHPRKRERPFAAGTLPLAWGLMLAPVLMLVAFGLSLALLPPLFTLLLGGYVVLTTAYSVSLKRQPVTDVIVLAALYTVRVIAGAAAIAVAPSFWLLVFSMFIFLSLALCKRYAELTGLLKLGELTAAGRGWHVDDLPLVESLGTGAGLTCVLVLALYVDSTSAKQLYATPEVLWLICPLLLFWISRILLLTHRGEMLEDPVVFTLKDRTSLAAVLLVLAIAVGSAL